MQNPSTLLRLPAPLAGTIITSYQALVLLSLFNFFFFQLGVGTPDANTAFWINIILIMLLLFVKLCFASQAIDDFEYKAQTRIFVVVMLVLRMLMLWSSALGISSCFIRCRQAKYSSDSLPGLYLCYLFGDDDVARGAGWDGSRTGIYHLIAWIVLVATMTVSQVIHWSICLYRVSIQLPSHWIQKQDIELDAK